MESAVKYNYMGRTGVLVSNMCFGGNTFGQKPFSLVKVRSGYFIRSIIIGTVIYTVLMSSTCMCLSVRLCVCLCTQ